MSLRTPLGRVRGLGSARSGTAHWWAQRVTAVALVPLGVWFLASMVGVLHADHATFTAWLRQPVAAVLMILFLGVAFYHMRLGLQVVIEDYVHGEGRKTACLLGATFFAFGVGGVAIFSVLKIALGS